MKHASEQQQSERESYAPFLLAQTTSIHASTHLLATTAAAAAAFLSSAAVALAAFSLSFLAAVELELVVGAPVAAALEAAFAAVAELLTDELLVLPLGEPRLFRWLLLGRLEEVLEEEEVLEDELLTTTDESVAELDIEELLLSPPDVVAAAPEEEEYFPPPPDFLLLPFEGLLFSLILPLF